MLQRATTRVSALRQVSRVVHTHPKSLITTIAKTGVTVHSPRRVVTRLSEYDSICRQQASTRISLAGFSTSETRINQIERYMTCNRFHDSVWGFVVQIYRCSQKHEAAWNRLLESLRADVQEGLESEGRGGMLKFHDLHVIDDKALYGATSHEVRDHFLSWVPENLSSRLRPGATKSQTDWDYIAASKAPRYEFCLFVDDICLESMDHPRSFTPVVKLLHKNWGPLPPLERDYVVETPFHDGVTEYDEEDVGWMYMVLHEYLYKYELLADDPWNMWDDLYVRPPYTELLHDDHDCPGNWRENPPKEDTGSWNGTLVENDLTKKSTIE